MTSKLDTLIQTLQNAQETLQVKESNTPAPALSLRFSDPTPVQDPLIDKVYRSITQDSDYKHLSPTDRSFLKEYIEFFVSTPNAYPDGFESKLHTLVRKHGSHHLPYSPSGQLSKLTLKYP